MKRTIFTLIVLLGLQFIVAQNTVTLTFTGRDAGSQRVQLDNVVISNLTRNWQETLYRPDTTLTLTIGVGIEEFGFSMDGIEQNYPNPCSGQTDVNLSLPAADAVALQLYDVNGRLCATFNKRLDAGQHKFSITLSTPQTYLLKVTTGSQSKTIKMVNIADGGRNGIEVASSSGFQLKGVLGISSRPFMPGDQMQYIGYSNGLASTPITQAQQGNELITLIFDFPTPPTVITSDLTNITASSATCGGNVTEQGSAPVTERGLCWSTAQLPSISDSHTAAGYGAGIFTSRITGLTVSTTYYVRAYATNSVGTSYGEQRSFTTPLEQPTITTDTVSAITSTYATCGGNVISQGTAAVTARGVCWSTSEDPTTADSHTTDGDGTGSFTSSIRGLTASTTYYVRAYATSSVGTSYGEQRRFTTPAPFICGGNVTDHQGNTYNTVQIGTQCWMAENMRCTTSPTGKTWGNQPYPTTYTPFYAHTTGTENGWSYDEYYYNWVAAIDYMLSSNTEFDYQPSEPCRGICPPGWHIPTDAEWTTLTNYAGANYGCNSNSSNNASALASQTGWRRSTRACSVGSGASSSNNATGFGAVPAGYYSGNFYGQGEGASFWSATQGDSGSAYSSNLNYSSASVSRANDGKNYGLSVRCILDE